MAALRLPPVQKQPLIGVGCTVPYAQFEHYAPVIRQLGLRPEILLTSADVLGAKPEQIDSVAKACQEFGGATCHAPFISLFWGDTDEAMKNSTEEVLLRAAEVASQLGVFSAVIHPNWDPRQIPSHDEWLTSSVPGMVKVTDRFIELGVQPLIENVREYLPAQILRLLAELPEETGVCIDPGHAGVISEVPVATWFDTIGDKLAEIHMHNNDGSSDQHRSLDEGIVWNPQEILKELIKGGRRFHPVIEPKDQDTAQKSLKALVEWQLFSPSN